MRVVLGPARRHAGLRLSRARGAGRRPRGGHRRRSRRRGRVCTRCRRRSSRRAPYSAASARPGWWSPRPTCSRGCRVRATTRSARRCPATSAAALDTPRSSTRSDWRPERDPEAGAHRRRWRNRRGLGTGPSRTREPGRDIVDVGWRGERTHPHPGWGRGEGCARERGRDHGAPAARGRPHRRGRPARRRCAEDHGPVRLCQRPVGGRDALGAHGPEPARTCPHRRDRHRRGP